MATGMAIMGFGGGAMIAAPVKKWLLQHFYVPPQWLGHTSDVNLITENGRRLANSDGKLVEVVVANANDIIRVGVEGLQEGVYVVSTGSTGTAMTFLTLGSVYFVSILGGAFAYRVPPSGYNPTVLQVGDNTDRSVAWKENTTESEHSEKLNVAEGEQKFSLVSAGITDKNVHIDTALRTPQFYQLWLNLFCNVTAGIGVIGVAKTMVSDIFGTTMPNVVDTAFAASYVGAIGIANMAGRFVWASSSDYLGRKNTYHLYFGLGIPLYLSIPFAAEWVGSTPGVAPLVMFTTSTMIIFSMYGGGFSTIPAYLADVFGEKYVGGIHGRLLTAWATAGVAGPVLVTYLRKASMNEAIQKLTNVVNAEDFNNAFGSGKEDLQMLIDNNVVTISKLMQIAPQGTIDPSCSLYNSTMGCMAGILGVALVSNTLVRPVHQKYHMKTNESKYTKHTRKLKIK